MKKVLLLGATGSIGKSTIDVIRQYPDHLSLVGLQAHSQEEALLRAAEDFPQALLCLSGKMPRSERITHRGSQGIETLIEESQADIVLNAIVGAAGLRASLKTLGGGIDLALANKESMVLGGGLLKEATRNKGCRLLPVDSEHAALFRLLEGRDHQEVAEIILTASGGPFRERTSEEVYNVTPEEALAHPTWQMGPKISIDSATMANKGLEVIEAWQLFDFRAQEIRVLVHPQSYVHALIRTKDQALYAQISAPDMRLPIQDALLYPRMEGVPASFLDLSNKSLQFYQADLNRFPLLKQAFETVQQGASYPIAYNGANEVAVEAFLKRRIPFGAIPQITARVLEADWSEGGENLESILTQDSRARTLAKGVIKEYANGLR